MALQRCPDSTYVVVRAWSTVSWVPSRGHAVLWGCYDASRTPTGILRHEACWMIVMSASGSRSLVHSFQVSSVCCGVLARSAMSLCLLFQSIQKTDVGLLGEAQAGLKALYTCRSWYMQQCPAVPHDHRYLLLLLLIGGGGGVRVASWGAEQQFQCNVPVNRCPCGWEVWHGIPQVQESQDQRHPRRD